MLVQISWLKLSLCCIIFNTSISDALFLIPRFYRTKLLQTHILHMCWEEYLRSSENWGVFKDSGCETFVAAVNFSCFRHRPVSRWEKDAQQSSQTAASSQTDVCLQLVSIRHTDAAGRKKRRQEGRLRGQKLIQALLLQCVCACVCVVIREEYQLF